MAAARITLMVLSERKEYLLRATRLRHFMKPANGPISKGISGSLGELMPAIIPGATSGNSSLRLTNGHGFMVMAASKIRLFMEQLEFRRLPIIPAREGGEIGRAHV